MTPKKVVRRIVKVSDLKNAPYNPPNRISPQKTRELEDSMQQFGLLSPLIITPHDMVIDGHRRLAVAKRLKWTEIECNVLSDVSSENIYSSVNVTSRRMSGNDALGVWLKCRQAVTLRVDKQFCAMTDVIGLPLVQKIFDAGLSMRVFKTAVQIAKYCDDSTNETVAAVVRWLLDFATIGQVMKALEAGVDPMKIMKAVNQNKPIILKLELA